MLQESVVKIKDSLSQGKTREDVYKEMLAVGISLEEIENAFNQVNQEGVEKTSQDNTQKNAILIIVSIRLMIVLFV